MLRLTRTGLGLLTRQYRSVLRKCWLINVGLWQTMGDAVSTAVSVPARLIASLFGGGSMTGEAFNVLDEILLERLFERKLATLTAIGLGIAAATMPNEANAAAVTGTGVLCYSGTTVTYHSGVDTCPSGTKLATMSTIDSSATVGDYSMALGYMAQATASSSIALGPVARATASSSIALGNYAYTKGNYSIAQGYGAFTGYKSNGDRSYIYSSPSTSPTDAIAIGRYAGAMTDYSIALGYLAQAGKGQTTTDYTSAVAIGYQAKATGLSSMALGYKAQAISDHSTALGGQAMADMIGAVALGYGSYTSEAYAVSVGSGNDTHASTYQYRKIINVADGTGDHDAVTYGQVKGNIKGLSVSGQTITYTKVDGSTGEITTQDTNTTYSADGSTLALSSENVFSIKDSGVTSAKIADGTIKNADIATDAAIASSKISFTTAQSNVLGSGIYGVDDSTIKKDTNGKLYVNSIAASKVSGLATVATTGKYSDLTGKPTIGEAVLKITSGGTETSFSANATTGVNLNLDNNYYTK